MMNPPLPPPGGKRPRRGRALTPLLGGVGVGRFMESLLSFFRVHLDHGPFHTPGQGTRPTSCRPGALTGRFMESLLSFFHTHWDYEPRTSETAPPRCCRHLAGSAFLWLVCRQDAGSTLGFLESLLSLSRMHWDHEPFHTPGQGTRPTSCRPGALTGRFM